MRCPFILRMGQAAHAWRTMPVLEVQVNDNAGGRAILIAYGDTVM